MKKSTKWLLVIIIALLVVLTVTVIVSIFLDEGYLKKLSYDDVDNNIYNKVMIVSEDGAFHLVVNGEKSRESYSYLKSVNDFYTETDESEFTTRPLYGFYLAKKADSTNYWLVHADGTEYRIAGENLSLSEASLPFLIFTNNTNSRMAAISLRSLSSEMSAVNETETGNELILTQTFLRLSAKRLDTEDASYDYLIAQNDNRGKQNTVFSTHGKKLFEGGGLSLLSFEKEEGDPTHYFVDDDTHSIYSQNGELLSVGEDAPMLSPDKSWAFQYRSSDTDSADDAIFLLSADHAFFLQGAEYDLSTLRLIKNCIVVERLHEHVTDVIRPADRQTTSYQTVVEQEGFLQATSPDHPGWIYLSTDGKELLRSSYDDMMLHELTTDVCHVFTSPTHNKQLDQSAHAYFFVSESGKVVEKRLASDESLKLPEDLCRENVTSPIYLFVKNDQDGTPLYRIYTPFASNQESSNSYHAIDFYCHGGILWALGTSYQKEAFDILDPVNNTLTISVAAKDTDLARLSFEYCETHALLADPYDRESGIPTILLRLTRYEDKQSGISNTRYFALYRTALASSKAFSTASLQVKELGQKLLMSHPYEFFPAKNALVIHHSTGSRIYRYDETNRLIECASVPYYVSDLLQDGSNAASLYLKISTVIDHNALLTGTEHFGIASENGTLLLPPIYENIIYGEHNRFVLFLRRACGVVTVADGDVETLVDFEYNTILPLADDAYLANAFDGTYDLYIGDDREERGILTYSSIRSIQTADDGYPIYATSLLLNLDGTLYYHEPQRLQSKPCTSVSRPPSHSADLADRRAKLISYYDAEGVLSGSDLLLPTVTDQKNLETNHTDEWYLSPLAEEQLTPVTVTDLLSSKDHFFHLYPKAENEEPIIEAP
ncbi:MAG: hypothetical protein IKA76_05950 [Clostridia bacterium]|nr:hypothetical protein [Clostridia bacterium]